MKKETQKRMLSILLALAMVFTIGIQSSAYAQTNDGSLEPATDEICSKFKTGVDWDKLVPGEDYVPGEMVVTFSDDLESEELIYEIASEYGFEVMEVMGFSDWKGGKTAGLYIPEEMSVPDAISKIEQDPLVQFATPNGIFQAYSAPNDPNYGSQWYLNKIGVNNVWDLGVCTNEVTVAVLDSGIDFNHPDLQGRILTNYAWDAVTNSALTGDYGGHGTHVAGIIAAITNNNTGIAGMSNTTKIIPVRVFAGDDPTATETEGATLMYIWKGFRYIIDNVDCDTLKVINLSFGVTIPYQNLELAVYQAASKGIVIVCGAGNVETGVTTYPASYEPCVAVTATKADDTIWSYSASGSWVDICAPGNNILSTMPVSYGSYGYVDGTSSASSVVSGVVALMFAANPDLISDEIKFILYDTAVDLGASGKDNTFGWGRVNAYASVLRAYEGYWERISGSDRYFTMKKLSHKGWPDNSCDTVIVATGQAFPDALAGTALAGVYGSPLILTQGNILSPQAAAEIQRLGADDVIIVGGTGAVSDSVKTSIEGIVGTGHVTRVYGNNRFTTSYNIYSSCINDWSDTLIVATGMSAADVLSISPYAYASHSPIFLADQNGNLNSNMQTAIQAGNFDKAIIIGSNTQVSSQTEILLTTVLGTGNVIRLYGIDRYRTSSEIADWESGEMLSATVQPSVILNYANVGVVNGANDNFADALAGGPFCGENGSVMLLTPNQSNDNYTVQNNIVPHTGDIEIGYIIGGTGALSDSFEQYLELLCQ